MLGIIVYNTKGKREIHPNPKRPRYYNFGRVNGTVLLIRLYSHGLYRERLATLLGSRDGQVKREGLKCNKKTEVHFGLFMRFYTGSVSFGSASDHAMLKVLLGIIAGLRPQPHVGVRDTQGSPPRGSEGRNHHDKRHTVHWGMQQFKRGGSRLWAKPT